MEVATGAVVLVAGAGAGDATGAGAGVEDDAFVVEAAGTLR